MESFLGADGVCAVLRTKKKWSRGELASRAGVSIKVISAIEERKYVDMTETKISPNKKRAAARGVAQVAIALGEDAEKWINSLANERAEYRLDLNQTAEVLEGARGKVRHSLGSGERDYGITISQALNKNFTHSINVPVGFRDYQGKEEFHEFQVELVRRILRLLHHGLQPEDETFEKATDFEALFANLSKPDNPYRLIIGPPRVPSRTFRFPLEFIDIPGLSMRLVALVRSDSTLEWDDIVAGPRHHTRDGPPLRLLAVKEGVSHIYVRNYLGYSNEHIHLVSKWTRDDIKRHCKQFLAAGAAISSRTAVVVDEYAAVRVRREFRETAESLELKVLSGPSSPTFPLALATRKADERWMTMLEQSLDELFVRLPQQMASMYFEKILKPFIDELYKYNDYDDDGFRQFARDPKEIAPSYLHIYRHKALSPEFWATIKGKLDDLIQNTVYARAIQDAGVSTDILNRVFLSTEGKDDQ